MGYSFKWKRSETIIKAYQKFLKQLNRKPNKIGVDKVTEFYNGSKNPSLETNSQSLYLACKEGNSFFAERLIRTLKNKICKYMTAISNDIYS